MSKILVIGHSVLDRIYYKNKLTLKPGGIFHTINTLVNLIEKDDEIYLATHFTNESFQFFEDAYKKVNLKYSEITNSIPTVTLHLHDNKERDEQFSNRVQKINIRSIEFSEFDVILINMISGFDIDINDLKEIRENSNATIYFDIHTLSRGIDESGKRNFRIIPEIEGWLNNIDILQMNENEMLTLFGNITETDIVKKILENRVENIIITKGENGVAQYNHDGLFSIPSIKVNSKNLVGCGDSFGAAFSFHYSKNRDLNSALDFANLVAGIITTYQTTSELKNLKKDIREYD